ncbi:MAG: ATP-binding protein [Cyclobacteriaceae bacterium]|nr:ATP-binding protein [Cyclobacteriaceae bacterium]
MEDKKFGILYVDDEQDNLDVFESTFWKEYDLHLAKSASEGMELLDKEDIQLIITDQRMPLMTGVEFLEKTREKFPKVMRMILTGFSDMGAIIEAVNKGEIVNYINKPWKKDELKLTIDKALETYSLREENQQLLIQLQKSNKNLEDLNAHLEEKVEERTQELETKNSELMNTMYNLRNAQAQLLQSEKLASLGMLSAAIGHEIRNPVGMVKGALDIIKLDLDYFIEVLDDVKMLDGSNLSDVEKLKEKISSEEYYERKNDLSSLTEDALDGTIRTLEIIKSLRNFSGSSTDKWEQVDIHEGIDSTLLLLKLKLADTGIKVVKNYDESIGKINCLPGLLYQVFMNIIANGVDAIVEESKRDGVIEITTVNKGSSVQIKIKDNGVGMSENVMEHVFEAFYSTKDQDKGTGLGLNLSKDIIDKHKGEISITSEIGEGAEFKISLPVSVTI